MTDDQVLVTGGTGFLGTHVIAQLLGSGHRVRTTVRDLGREDELREALASAGVQSGDALQLVVADLSEDDGWNDAVEGVRFVLHVASPFPPAMPDSDDDVIRPAREGALRVLRASRDAGVDRVVMTSSFAAVGYGHEPTDEAFDEHTWTNVDAPLSAYIRSKALAERAAWDFMDSEGGDLELAVVNPVGIFGPPLTSDLSASTGLAHQMMTAMPAVPRLATTVVDVRDAADLHLRAMTDPAAAGERFLASTGEPLTFQEVARILRAAVGHDLPELPLLPDEAVHQAARTDPGMAGMVGELGKVRRVSSEKARTVLGWTPRSSSDALEATARALRDLGLLGE
ncbi:SDR family oxidoreductase [Aeromicrobium fastidiosum]|uniref:Aldehyde reductase n=1 Tax=Aeromicrobium fastidiosum TaxID=52699 RepID=A0A641AKZ5_9ACTN|nr:aldehyde reductase [Aeromicrobium fastidiosum]KAA1376350.1 aldehyde reductase [Aeromicrobium fastidiosum]MBP2391750.1 dihydroflavonol-4-reductase [Aeromicrobium fastidiosum]